MNLVGEKHKEKEQQKEAQRQDKDVEIEEKDKKNLLGGEYEGKRAVKDGGKVREGSRD